MRTGGFIHGKQGVETMLRQRRGRRHGQPEGPETRGTDFHEERRHRLASGKKIREPGGHQLRAG